MGEEKRGRVIRENEGAAGDALAREVGEATFPGIFAGGKQIIRTIHESGSPAKLIFFFGDGSAMQVVGDFTVKYRAFPEATTIDIDFVVEQQSRELPSGD
jgi:hypothetical protein